MKKKLLIIGIVLSGFFMVYNILGQTGLLKVFHNPSMANEPNLKLGTYFITTNLKTPEKGDFISYIHNDKFLGRHYRIHRLCAIEGDIVEIKNGILFVNRKNFDANKNLMHLYAVSKNDYQILPKHLLTNEYGYPQKGNETTYNVLIDDQLAREKGFFDNKIIEATNEENLLIQSIYNKNWNKDNFGPFQIPQGKAFVIGDNRDNSEDSRYFGPIELENIKGKLIWM